MDSPKSEFDSPHIDEQVPTASQDSPQEQGRDWTGLLWSGVLIVLVVLGSWSWFGQVRYDPPLYGDDAETRAALADLRRIESDVELSMTVDSKSRWILGDGFGVPEEDGTWIAAVRSNLLFELDGDASSIELFFYPLLAPSLPERPITVTTSEGIFQFLLTGGGQWVSGDLSPGASHEVIIKCDTIDSPLDLGLGPDQRKLCAKLLAVRVNS